MSMISTSLINDETFLKIFIISSGKDRKIKKLGHIAWVHKINYVTLISFNLDPLSSPYINGELFGALIPFAGNYTDEIPL